MKILVDRLIATLKSRSILAFERLDYILRILFHIIFRSF